MMQRPWDRAQPDEWLPRSLRLCWGSSGGDGGGGWGGDSGGGGWSGDSGGGWGGDGGGWSGATTGGGDWGSSGSYDASGFNAGGDTNAWAGTAYDASVSGTGAGGGGDWASFGDTSYGSFNAPNPTYADVAGPNPGVTTGGGDWGSAGAFSAAGTGGGPGGAMFGATQGTGGGWSTGDYGGGFTGYGGGGGSYGGGGGTYGGGGGGGGYTGGGGGKSGGGSFGSFGSGTLGGSNAVSSVTGPAFADTAGSAGGHAATVAAAGKGEAPTTSEAQSESAAPDAEAAPSESEAAPDAPDAEPLGSPAPSESEAAPEAEAGPSLSDAAPAGNIGGGHAAVGHATQTEAAPAQTETSAPTTSAFGPQTLSYDYAGSPYADMGPQAAPQQDSFDSRFGFDTAAPQDSFDSRFGDWGQQPDAAPSPAYQDVLQSLSGLTQTALDPPSQAYQGINPGAEQYAFEPAGPTPTAEPGWFQSLISDIPGVTTPAWAQDIGKSLTDVNTWLSPLNQQTWNEITNIPNTLNPNNWVDINSPLGSPLGSTTTAFDLQAAGEQGKAGQLQDTFDSRFAVDPNTDTTNWGAVFEGAAPTSEEGINPGAEQYGVETGINPGAEQYGIETAAPAIEAFIQGGRETDFANAAPGAIEASIPGGRETDFAGSPAETAAQSAAAAAQQAGVSPEAAGAAAAAAYAAAARGASPAEQAEAAAGAAEQAGASQQQAMAIANGVYGQAQEGGGRPQSQGTTLGQVLDAVYGTGGPYITPEGNVYGGHTVADIQAAVYGDNPPGMPTGNPNAPLSDDTSQQSYASTPGGAQSFIPGGQVTNFEYAGSPQAQPQQAPPPSLVEMAQPGINPGAEQYGTQSPPAPPSPPAPEVRPETGDQIDTNRDADRPASPPGIVPGAPNVVQGQQGATRSQPLSPRLEGVLDRAAERAGVQVRVYSGGQPATGPNRTGSHRHDHGNAADLQIFDRASGRALDMTNPQDRGQIQTFLREAVRLGATGIGGHPGYMGSNRFHVGFGGAQTWGPNGRGSPHPTVQEAWEQGMRGGQPAGRQNQQARPAPPPGGWRGIGGEAARDARQAQQQSDAARPPADIPRPPADIPPQARVTFYAPGAGGRMEGKFETSRPNPNTGKNVPSTLDDVRLGNSPFVTVAADPSRYGENVNLGDISYTSPIDGKTYTLHNVQGIVHDTGPAFKGRPDKSDVAVGDFRGWNSRQASAFVQNNGRQPGLPGGGLGIGSDYAAGEAQPDAAPPTQQAAAPTPPADVSPQQPAALPPVAPVDDARPPADIPSLVPPRATGPNEFDIPVTPPVRNATVIANNILKQATAHLNTNSGEAALNAAGVVAAKAMAAAGIPANLARSLMLKGAMDGAIANGYGPGGKNSTVMGFSIWGRVQSTITESVNAAMQGYHPAKPGELQGPPSPVPGKQGSLGGLLHLAAGGRDVGAPPAIQGFPGRDYKEGEIIGNPDLMIEDRGLGTSPPAPPLGLQDPNSPDRPFMITPPFAPPGPANPPGERQASLLDILQDVPFGGFVQLAGGRDVGAPALDFDLPGQAGTPEWAMPPGGLGANLNQNAPVDPRSETIFAPGRDQIIIDPDVLQLLQQEQQQYQQQFDPRGWRQLAKGGHVAKDEPVVVGEEGPEFFVPDQPGTVVPHMPPGGGGNFGRWPKVPAPDYPGRYAGLGREMKRQMREAQDPSPVLLEMIDSGRVRLDQANWDRMLNDPDLIALGRSRMDDRREGIDPGAEQYGAFMPASEPAAEPPDPTSAMAQALGYGSIKRRPLRVGRQSY